MIVLVVHGCAEISELRIQPQRPDGLSCLPDLLVVNHFQPTLKIFVALKVFMADRI
jgi:hypothetical protein